MTEKSMITLKQNNEKFAELSGQQMLDMMRTIYFQKHLLFCSRTW